MAVGDNSEGSIKYGIIGAGPGRNVQGGGAIGVTLWKRELGGDQLGAQDPEGVPPSGGTTDHRDYGAGGEWEYPTVEEVMDSIGLHLVGVYIKRRKTTITERATCQPVYALCTEAEDARDELCGTMVGLRRGKRAGGINEEEV